MPMAASDGKRHPALLNRLHSFFAPLVDSLRDLEPREIALGILLVTVVVYSKVCVFDFIDFDDPLYLTQNQIIQTGLNAKSLYYAFTTTIDGSYLPIVWISHAACVSLFSHWAGGHHLVNLALHLANTTLLFYFLRRTTGLKWPSAGVALLFAVHPLHVESVAWIAERKDVLGTLFWLLTSWVYVSYTERPSAKRYLYVLILFALGLLSKSMLMTLPVTLLLLDYWPLNRINVREGAGENWSNVLFRIFREKIPLLIMSFAAAFITFSLQHNVGATNAQALLPIEVRIGTALMSSFEYLRQTVWPIGLSPFYPYPEILYRWKIRVIFLMIVLITIGTVIQARRRPYLMVGWFWYLITLAPVAGIIQIGSQAHADRYTYIPLIGIFISAIWILNGIYSYLQRFKLFFLWSLGAIFTMTSIFSFYQVQIWRNSYNLWSHALKLNPNNFLAHQRLGDLYYKEGRYSEACAAYRRASDYLQSYSMFIKLGDVLELMGFSDQALAVFSSALGQHTENGQLWPSHPPLIDQRMARSLTRLGRYDEADHYNRTAIQRLYPGGAATASEMTASLIDRAVLLRGRDDCSGAVRTLESVLEYDPKSDLAHLELGLTFYKLGQSDAAFHQVELTSKQSLERPDLLYRRGLILAGTRHFIEAQDSFKLIEGMVPGSPLAQSGSIELDRIRRSTE